MKRLGRRDQDAVEEGDLLLFGGGLPRVVVVLAFQLVEMRQQFRLRGQAAEVEADHLVRPQRRLATGPEADEQTGDDRTVGLNFDAVLAVAEPRRAGAGSRASV